MDGHRDDYIESHTPTAATPLGTPPSVTPSIYDRLQRLASQGYSKTDAAKAVGLHRHTVSKVTTIDWPPQGFSRKVIAHRERQQTDKWRRRRSQQVLARQDGKKYNVPDGRMMTVREIAAESGLSEQTIRTRLRRGHDVFASANELRKTARKGPRNKTWTVHMSQSDWSVVLEYAREKSAKSASCKFGVPQGAISAVLRGEAWRVIGYPKDLD